MAQFTNQATLSYGTTVRASNIAVGEVIESLSVTKTAVNNTYGQNDTITYIISLTNSSASAVNNITVTDNLGTYPFGSGTLTPLSYVEGTVKYFQNGVLTASPEVTVNPTSIEFGPLSIPENGNAILVYETLVNDLAPLGANDTITNEASVIGCDGALITATETVSTIDEPNVTITKSICPVPVTCGGTVTYTFMLENTGNTALVATDDAVIKDLFSPALSDLQATFNGVTWTQGTEYNYDEETGLFESVPSVITVPAATFTQDPVTGVVTSTPGTSTLVITGTI